MRGSSPANGHARVDRTEERGLMPKGPQGQERPTDAIGLAVMVGKIATGEIEDTPTMEADEARAL